MLGIQQQLAQFLNKYQKATNTHNFDNVAPLIDPNAIYWFSDGSFKGIAEIRKAFIKTWNTIRDEKYNVSNVEWLVINEDLAICIYTFHWQGNVDAKPKSGSGRGTNLIVKKSGKWMMQHEHLSSVG